MYSEDRQKALEGLDKSVRQLEKQAQTNLNARLDKMRFKNYSIVEFTQTAPHPDTDISFVTNLDQSVSLYKGDTEISGTGSEDESDIEYLAWTGRRYGVDGRFDPCGIGQLPSSMLLYRYEFENNPVTHSGSDSFYAYHSLRSATNLQATLCVQGSKAFLDSRICGSSLYDGFDTWGIVGFKAPCAQTTDILKLYRDDGNGGYQEETITVTTEIDAIIGDPDDSATTRTFTPDGWEVTGDYSFGTYALRYMLIINRSCPAAGINQTTEIRDLPASWKVVSATAADRYTFCGFMFGFGMVDYIGVVDSPSATMSDFKMLRKPCLLWLPRISEYAETVDGATYTTYYHPSPRYLEESPQRPYGLRYDISTGDELAEPIIPVSNLNEQMWNYAIGLPKSITIEED